jgi:hypothetical protein
MRMGLVERNRVERPGSSLLVRFTVTEAAEELLAERGLI